MTTPPVPIHSASDLRHLRRSFVRHLAADGRSAATRVAYSVAIAQLETFLSNQRLPTTVMALRPDHLEAFFVSLYERQLRPATILARHHALSRFFGWLIDEGELTSSPMANLRPPATHPSRAMVLTTAQIEAVLAACAGPAFEDVRDAAMIRLFVDTGMRLTGMAGLQLDEVDLECKAAYVAGTGNAPRVVPFDTVTARALERYLALRAGHDHGHLPALWLGRRGRLTARGVDEAVRHRGQLAGLPNLHPGQFRHTFVQQYLADGGDGRDLMRLVGWKSRQLLGRYGADALAERPRAEWLRLGDRL